MGSVYQDGEVDGIKVVLLKVDFPGSVLKLGPQLDDDVIRAWPNF